MPRHTRVGAMLAGEAHGMANAAPSWPGTVVTTSEYDAWFQEQPQDIQDRLIALQLELADKGPTMGMEGSKVLDRSRDGKKPLHLRELRVNRPAIRVLYTFDPQRNAVLLYGGDKSGTWQDWYPHAKKQAEAVYRSYLDTLPDIRQGGRR